MPRHLYTRLSSANGRAYLESSCINSQFAPHPECRNTPWFIPHPKLNAVPQIVTSDAHAVQYAAEKDDHCVSESRSNSYSYSPERNHYHLYFAHGLETNSELKIRSHSLANGAAISTVFIEAHRWWACNVRWITPPASAAKSVVFSLDLHCMAGPFNITLTIQSSHKLFTRY